jgi:hypothetical protein
MSAHRRSVHATHDSSVWAAKFFPHTTAHRTTLLSPVWSAFWYPDITADVGSVKSAHRCSLHATHDTSVRAAKCFPHRTAHRTALLSPVWSAFCYPNVTADVCSVQSAHRCSHHAAHTETVWAAKFFSHRTAHKAAEHFPYRTADRTAL